MAVHLTLAGVRGCDAGQGDALLGGNHHALGCYRLLIVNARTLGAYARTT